MGQIGISHLHPAKVPPEELRRLRGKAIHVQISDCDGKKHGDLPPGRGVVRFEPYLREIKALGMEEAVSIELEFAPEPDEDRGVGDRGLPRHGPTAAGGEPARLSLRRMASQLHRVEANSFPVPAFPRCTLFLIDGPWRKPISRSISIISRGFRADRSLPIGCVGGGFIMADCHLVVYR